MQHIYRFRIALFDTLFLLLVQVVSLLRTQLIHNQVIFITPDQDA